MERDIVLVSLHLLGFGIDVPAELVGTRARARTHTHTTYGMLLDRTYELTLAFDHVAFMPDSRAESRII